MRRFCRGHVQWRVVVARNSPKALRKSYRALLAAELALFLLATLLVSYLLYQSHQRYLANAAATSQNLALSLEHFLHAHFQENDLALQSAADEFRRMHEEKTFSRDAYSSYLIGLRKRLPTALSIRGTDPDGWAIYGDQVDARKLFNLSRRNYFRQARSGKRLVFGLPLKSMITGQWLFPMAKPVSFPDGRF